MAKKQSAAAKKQAEAAERKRNQLLIAAGVTLAAVIIIAGLFVGAPKESTTGTDTSGSPSQSETTGGTSGGASSYKATEDMSFQQIAEATGIPIKMLAQNYGVEEPDYGKPIKEIGGKYNFTIDDVNSLISKFISNSSGDGGTSGTPGGPPGQ